ncbi:MAG TPA: hypothetical protein EYQ83_03055 [Acidobacteria bacterium]|nr:hypothetical protein [Acidobacteriota bacterium]
MKVAGQPWRTIMVTDDGRAVDIIDQTLLPHRFETRRLETLEDAAEAITVMRVRGAPLISATSISRVMRARRNRPLFIVDIGLPRDVDPAAGELEQVFLYNIDDLRAMISENLVRRQEQTVHAEAMIGAEVDEFVVWQRSRGSIPTLVALRRRFEAVRESELERLAPKLNGLSPDARARLDEVTRLLVQKLLLTPTERLKTTADEETAAQYVEALTQLFSLSEPHPADNPDRTDDVDGAGSSDTTQASMSKTPVTS